MANNNFGIYGATYNPFTYDEMIKPLQMATEAQNKVEDAYTDLMIKAATVEAMANGEQDKEVYQRYKTYADNLKAQADEIATRGINPSSRRTLMGLNKEYAETILPIQTAYARRQALSDEQRKALASNPTALFDRDMSQVGLQDFIDDPNISYKSHSGAVLAKQVSDAAAALAKDIREDNPRAATIKQKLDPYTYELIRQYGFSREDVLQAIYDPAHANPALTSIVKQVYDASGINDWDNDEAKKQAAWYASQGLWSAVGETKFSQMDNYGAKLNAQYNKELGVARAKAAMNGDDASTAQVPLYPVQSVLPARKGDNSGITTTFMLPFNKPEDVFENYYASRVSNGNLRLKEIVGRDKDDSVKTKDTVLKTKDIYDDKNKLKSSPRFMLSASVEMPGIVLSWGGKHYLLDPNTFDDNVQNTVFGPNGALSAAAEAREHMVVEEDPNERLLWGQVMQEYMKRAITILNSSLAGTYAQPSYKTSAITSKDLKE